MNIPVDIMFYVFFAVGIMRLFSFKRLLGTFIGASIAFGAMAYSTSAKAENLMGTCNDDTRVTLGLGNAEATGRTIDQNIIVKFFNSIFDPASNDNPKIVVEAKITQKVNVGFCADVKAKTIWWGQDGDISVDQKNHVLDKMHAIVHLGKIHKHSKFVTLPNGNQIEPLHEGWSVIDHQSGKVIVAKLDDGNPMQLSGAFKGKPTSIKAVNFARAGKPIQHFASHDYLRNKNFAYNYRTLTVHHTLSRMAQVAQTPVKPGTNLSYSYGGVYHQQPV